MLIVQEAPADRPRIVVCLTRRPFSVGSAVGVAIFGAVANAIIADRGGPESAAAVQAGSTAVFLAVLIASVITILAGLLMPAVRAEGLEQLVGGGD